MLCRLIAVILLLEALNVSNARASTLLDAPIQKRYAETLSALKKTAMPAARKTLLEAFVSRVEQDVAAIPDSLSDEAVSRASEFFELQAYTKNLRLDALSHDACQFNRRHTLNLSNPRGLEDRDATEIGRFVLEILGAACQF